MRPELRSVFARGRARAVLGAGAVIIAVVLIATPSVGGSVSTDRVVHQTPSTTAQPTTAQPSTAPPGAVPSTTVPGSLGARSDREPGRIAYVTLGGDVVVAESNGSNAKVIGTGAVSNSLGLAPLAWRQPSADAVTYVRNDRALVVAPVDGSTPTVLANDAVVPADADESILSWDLTGTLLIYLAEPRPGRVESRVVDFSKATATLPPEIRTIGTPGRRRTLAQSFSPIDPLIYQRTVDPDTGREFTVSIVDPISGSQFGTPYTLDDSTFSPDGRYIFAVSKGVGNLEQLVRLSVLKPGKSDLVTDRNRICRPRVSPNATMIVFAAGRDCGEIWTIKADGSDPTRIVRRVGPSATFAVGEFSWSGDGATITHAACTLIGTVTRCGGGFWNISVDGKTVRPGAEAGSVLRETRPLLKPVKLKVEISGAIELTSKMQVGTKSVGQLLSRTADDVVEVKAVDEADNARSVEMKLVRAAGAAWLSGTIRVIDGKVDETFPFFGSALPSSYGYAKLRGIWFRSESVPLEAGQVVIVLER